MTMATISVVAVKYIGANLVEVDFSFQDGSRQRVIVPRRHTNVDDVQFAGRALQVLTEQGRVPV